MITISKRSQIFSPGADFSLSGLSAQHRSKIEVVWGLNPLGTIIQWRPNSVFPQLAVLRKDNSYMIRSVLSSGSFTAYDLPIESGGSPGHDDQMVRPIQFFTNRRESNFPLSQLSTSVRSKIRSIYAEPVGTTGNFINWTPSSPFPTISAFVSGRTYVIESIGQGFSSYRLGVPDPPAENPIEFLNDALLPDIGLIPAEYVGV